MLTRLSDEFWRERPLFTSIRGIARARMLSPDALLACVLGVYSARSDCRATIPHIVVKRGNLGVYIVLVGRSGAGKSAYDVAREIVPKPVSTAGRWREMPIGSSAGVLKGFFLKEKAGRRHVWVRAVNGLFLYADEYRSVAEIAGQPGMLLGPTLDTAFTNGTLGHTWGGDDARLDPVETSTYRISYVAGLQPDLAHLLLSDDNTAAGHVQRHLFVPAAAVDPDESATWHEETLTVEWPDHDGDLTYADTIWKEVRATRAQWLRDALKAEPGGATAVTEPDDSAMDSHRVLTRLKVAGLLGMLDGRVVVDITDWHLAGAFTDVSAANRDDLIEHGVALKATADRKREVDRAVHRAAGAEEAVTDQILRAAHSLSTKVHDFCRGSGKAEVPRATGRNWYTSGLRVRDGWYKVAVTAASLDWLRLVVDEEGLRGPKSALLSKDSLITAVTPHQPPPKSLPTKGTKAYRALVDRITASEAGVAT